MAHDPVRRANARMGRCRVLDASRQLIMTAVARTEAEEVLVEAFVRCGLIQMRCFISYESVILICYLRQSHDDGDENDDDDTSISLIGWRRCCMRTYVT